MDCVRVSMCVRYVDVRLSKCVVSECERVNEVDLHMYIHVRVRSTSIHTYPRRCKTSLVGQSAGLLVPRSPVRFRQKLQKSKTQKFKFEHIEL